MPNGTEEDEDDDGTIILKNTNEEDDDNGKTIYLWNTPRRKKIILKNIHTSERYEKELGKKLIIGRKGKECDIVIKGDQAISGHHCQMYLENGKVYLEDLNSSNGTSVNDHRVEEPVQIQNGDILKIGITELSITIDE